MAIPNTKPVDPTLHLPRMLCLHGGGVNAEVFTMQARSIIAALRPYFRLVFVDGPFFCDAGPGIAPVYSDFGPFRRWLRWLPHHQEIDAASAVAEIEYSIDDAMQADDRKGATGAWVALLGFSQGAKLSASLLFRQQIREARGLPTTGFRFAVILAGRAPLVSFDPELFMNPALVDASQISEGFEEFPEEWSMALQSREHVLKLPTIHMHGLQDKGLHLHRRLMEQYCEPGTTTVLEWNEGHRVPIAKKDVGPLIEQILRVATETGILPEKTSEPAAA